MKHLIFTIVILLALGVALAASGIKTSAATVDEREEIRKTYQLAPGARVRVSGLNGPVTVETYDGSTAEIYIERTARSREDLVARPVIIEATSDQLVIRTEKDREESRWSRDRNVRDRVNLRLPRRIDFGISGINGPVNVAEIEGRAEVSGVNGSVSFTQAATFSHISGINGKVTVGMTRIGEGGLKISGINGGVECRIGEAVNADLKTSGINGRVHVNLGRVTMTGEISPSRVNAKIGDGGPQISVSGINGSVQFNPLN
ncbi:MAG TPA: hypothetical protein VNQ79_12140 [Blastocatellia bacterium]|nr:hypothetical protein [Blastocatellia bacterium]